MRSSSNDSTTRVLYWVVGILLILLVNGGWRHAGNVLLFLGAATWLAVKLYPRPFRRLLDKVLRRLLRVPSPPAPDESWACAVCDTRNPPGVIECVHCRTTHDPGTGLEAPAAEDSGPGPDWRCRVCETVNPGDVNVCLRCSMPVRDPGDLEGVL
jgi:hypothetical protein